MEHWLQQHYHLLQKTKDKKELLEQLYKTSEALGFDYFAYGLRVGSPLNKPKTEMHNNYSPTWQKKYIELGFINRDPVIFHGARSSQPVIWDEKVFTGSEDLWEEARAHGLEHGWSQSCFGGAYGSVGLVTFARSGETLTKAELEEKLPYLMMLTQLAHMSLSAAIVPDAFPELTATLTPREAEILSWTADGKTADEIGLILGLAERTINFHISNVIKKLGVNNKTSAVARALQLHLIA